ncbi:MAG: nitroreductase family protein [Treponema sp.]|nr:nitroreductase family protein [Treponema sp.]
MKRLALFLVIAVLPGIFSLSAQQASNPAGAIINHYAARSFAAGTLPKADLDQIIQAGLRAPSASNRQPWHFTVVQNFDLAKKIVPQAVDGNALIVVSASGDSKTNVREIIDCALATESIYLAAQALGYGSRIYTGPIDSLNRSLKNELGLPGGYSAVALVRVGRVDGKTDAVSAASERKAADTLVTYK